MEKNYIKTFLSLPSSLSALRLVTIIKDDDLAPNKFAPMCHISATYYQFLYLLMY